MWNALSATDHRRVDIVLGRGVVEAVRVDESHEEGIVDGIEHLE